jgi:hypothetical protein
VLPRCGQGFSRQHSDRENDDEIEPPPVCHHGLSSTTSQSLATSSKRSLRYSMRRSRLDASPAPHCVSRMSSVAKRACQESANGIYEVADMLVTFFSTRYILCAFARESVPRWLPLLQSIIRLPDLCPQVVAVRLRKLCQT